MFSSLITLVSTPLYICHLALIYPFCKSPTIAVVIPQGTVIIQLGLPDVVAFSVCALACPDNFFMYNKLLNYRWPCDRGNWSCGWEKWFCGWNLRPCGWAILIGPVAGTAGSVVRIHRPCGWDNWSCLRFCNYTLHEWDSS